jgi:hypothetical protein
MERSPYRLLIFFTKISFRAGTLLRGMPPRPTAQVTSRDAILPTRFLTIACTGWMNRKDEQQLNKWRWIDTLITRVLLTAGTVLAGAEPAAKPSPITAEEPRYSAVWAPKALTETAP